MDGFHNYFAQVFSLMGGCAITNSILDRSKVKVTQARKVVSGQLSSRSVNPFPNKPLFLRVCSTSLLKTLWEKEKLLIMSNFSFLHDVFYPF